MIFSFFTFSASLLYSDPMHASSRMNHRKTKSSSSSSPSLRPCCTRILCMHPVHRPVMRVMDNNAPSNRHALDGFSGIRAIGPRRWPYESPAMDGADAAAMRLAYGRQRVDRLPPRRKPATTTGRRRTMLDGARSGERAPPRMNTGWCSL